MQNLIEFIQKHGVKGIVIVVLASIIAFLLSSCSVAKFSESGTVTTDKHSEKTYEVVLEK